MSKQVGTQGGSPTTLVQILPALYIGMYVVGGLASYFLVVKPLLEKLGIKKDKEDKANDEMMDITLNQGFWSPYWYKQNGGATISDDLAGAYAHSLYCAMFSGFYENCGNTWIGGGWGTAEGEIGSTFAQIGSKGNVSKVVEAYYEMFQDDLKSDLRSELNSTDFNVSVTEKISQYPS
jgi:hypothetical protein